MNDNISKNTEHVRIMIAKKKCLNKPFFATIEDSNQIITDYDHFPYTRWFRGQYQENTPVIIEREAGYRQRYDTCYTNIYKIEEDKPNVCFQNSCSTSYPCNPDISNENPLKDGLYSNRYFNLYR